RRTWRKLHLAVDAATHEVIAAEVSLESVADNEVLPTLLNPLRRKIKQVSADGAYDTKGCHKLLKRKGSKPTIPPRKNAGYWEDGHPRNEAVKALKSHALQQWKKDNDYHQRSLSETAMYRYKQLISPKLSLRDYNAQVGEALAGVKAMNKVIGLGMPVRQVVN
ncbi:IS5 family transposase, partial [Shewanella sp. AS16]|uniref:IS5 family transposase n=1 Tax=Shewanella sp. AS16 TaxID=2907625 RepID=UPI001F2F0500